MVNPSVIIFLLIFISCCITAVNGAKPKRARITTMLQEYREILPKPVFTNFNSIYHDKSLKTIEKLKLLDELFMALPDGLLKQLPVPSAFRRLPTGEQKKIHRIYFSKTLPFREKLRKLEQFLRELPGQARELVPIRPIEEKRILGSAERRGEKSIAKLVEFDVPVLLQFNGHMETNALKQYLAAEEFQLLKWILERHTIDEPSRARLVGILLKKAYQMKPDNFPLPLNGDSQEIADEIRHLGVRLMFGRNPFDRVDPFVQKFEMLKRLRTNLAGKNCRPARGANGEEPCRDDQEEHIQQQKPRSLLEAVDLFPAGVVDAEDWRQQDEAGNSDNEKKDLLAREEMENGRMNGDLLSKFIALFNGTIHWNL